MNAKKPPLPKAKPKSKKGPNPICFVVCPIGPAKSETRERSDRLLKYILEPVCNAYDLNCVRADTIPNPGVITNQIVEYLVDSALVIADLTDANPNVYYELAIRHCTGKPFIQIKHESTDVPFDIANVRTTPYSFDFEKIKVAKQAISDQILWITENPDKIINPVLLATNLATLMGGNPTEQTISQMLNLLASIDRRTGTIQEDVEHVQSVTGGMSIDTMDISGIGHKIDNLDEKVNFVVTEIVSLDGRVKNLKDFVDGLDDSIEDIKDILKPD